MPSVLNRANAERAAEHLAVHHFHCVTTIRAIRTQYNRQDLFAADVLGKTQYGMLIAIQATAGSHSAMTARRRKLEAIPWQTRDTVLVAQLREYPDPANRKRLRYAFRISEYGVVPMRPERAWFNWDESVPIPKIWFTAYKGASNEAKKRNSSRRSSRSNADSRSAPAGRDKAVSRGA